MQKSCFSKYSLLTVLSGMLAAVCFIYQLFLPSFICLIPLFVSLPTSSRKRSFQSGMLFGLTISCFCFFWMIEGAVRFTGANIFYGVIVFLISALLFSAYWGFTILGCRMLVRNMPARFGTIIQAFAISCLWIIAEELLCVVAESLPWFGYRAGFGLSSNMAAVQPAAYFGVDALSFAVVFCNYAAATAIIHKRYNHLWIPATAFVMYMLIGFGIQKKYESETRDHRSFRVAVASQNTEPETRWDEANGNRLAHELIDLAASAAGEKPQLVVWTESAVPWTYKPDDDLLKELVKAVPNTEQVIGINTDNTEKSVFNSAYHVNKKGIVSQSRYDKQCPLGFIEKPIAGILFPFLSQSGYRVAIGGGSGLLKTNYGNAGILLCNESSVSALAIEREKEGAQFLLNLSNDGWFSETYLADGHFASAVLRAVECRKDIAVCSNRGWSGVIRSTGEVLSRTKDAVPQVQQGEIRPNRFQTFYCRYSFFLYSVCILGLCVIAVVSQRSKRFALR